MRNVIMDVYVKNIGSMELARKLFDEMTERTVTDWNSMISGYWKWGFEAEVCELFDMMTERNVVTWTAMVSGYAKRKDLVSPRKYFDALPEKNVVSWNAMLSGYAQNGFAKEGLKLLYDMINVGEVEPNETTWVIVVSLCSSHDDPYLADSLMKMLERKQVRLNCFVKTALIDKYAKCGSIETAKRLFEELGVYRNVVS